MLLLLGGCHVNIVPTELECGCGDCANRQSRARLALASWKLDAPRGARSQTTACLHTTAAWAGRAEEARWLTVGVLPKPRTQQGRQGLAALIATPDKALVAFDYDGTLAPIVADPMTAKPQPAIVEALALLAERVGLVAIITGRPAQLAVDLAGLAVEPGLTDVVVLGHYGIECWDARTGQLQAGLAAPGVEQVRRELPPLLSSLGLADADIEDKELSVAVHVRRMAEPQQAFDVMREPLRQLADRADLAVEPGRLVMELRPRGMDKGQALRQLASDFDATSVTFTGDDLGDLAAFAEVRRLRVEGVPGLLVCSGSAEVTELAAQADLVVEGPPGVAAFISGVVMALGPASTSVTAQRVGSDRSTGRK